MINWIKRAKSWFLHWATTKWSGWAMFFCAFADASFLPLPTPLFFLTLALLNITRAYRYALLATIGTMAGAILGYSIGHFAWLNRAETLPVLLILHLIIFPDFRS